MEKTVQNTFKVGDGATYLAYTDRRAYTIIEISKNGRRAKIQRDAVKLLNGPNSGAEDALNVQPGGFCGHTSGVQRWDIQPDPNGEILQVSLRKDGRWRVSNNGTEIDMGRRYEYYDYNF